MEFKWIFTHSIMQVGNTDLVLVLKVILPNQKLLCYFLRYVPARTHTHTIALLTSVTLKNKSRSLIWYSELELDGIHLCFKLHDFISNSIWYMASTIYYRFQWEKIQNGRQSAILNLITKRNDLHMPPIMSCPWPKFELNWFVTFRDMVADACRDTQLYCWPLWPWKIGQGHWYDTVS